MAFQNLSMRSPRLKRNRSKSKKKKLSISVEKNDGYAPLTPPSKRSSRSSLKIQTNSLMSSLGTGVLGSDGSVVSFSPSPTARSKNGGSNFFSASTPVARNLAACYDGIAPVSTTSTVSTAKSRIIGKLCSYLRVSDLDMDDESMATMSVTSDSSFDPQEHSIRPVVSPPPGIPGIEIDPKERWVALCTTFDDKSSGDSAGSSASPEHTPIAPVAVGRLADFGKSTTLNEAMWQPDGKSDKLLKKASGGSEWMKQSFTEGVKQASTASDSSNDVLIWSGSFKHGLYGSEVPAIRSAGIVKTSSKKLMELLVDSTRVKEYNKISLGRTDLVTFDGSFEKEGPFGKSITKVMRSESKPPMMSNLALTSILHAKELSDGSGYLIVSRAVHRPGEDPSPTEIVMGVNLIVDFDSDDGTERCLMVNVNHMRSPMVPMYIAKKVAVTSAHKFVNDIRALV